MESILYHSLCRVQPQAVNSADFRITDWPISSRYQMKIHFKIEIRAPELDYLLYILKKYLDGFGKQETLLESQLFCEILVIAPTSLNN